MTVHTSIVTHMSLFTIITFLACITKIAPKYSEIPSHHIKMFIMIIQINRYTTFYTVVNNSFKMILGQFKNPGKTTKSQAFSSAT